MTKPASEAIAQELRRIIITGQLALGALVSEASLCDLLNCGRSPLREALQHLSHQYLVEIPPRRGVLIPQLSILDFQQAAEAMLFLGNTYAELAAERINDQQLQQINDIVAQQERCNRSGQFYELAELDCRFHTLIAEVTGNRYFTDSARRLHTSLARFTYRAWKTTGNADQSVAEHRRIVEALETRDPQLSKQRMSDHTTTGRQRVLHILGLGDQRQDL